MQEETRQDKNPLQAIMKIPAWLFWGVVNTVMVITALVLLFGCTQAPGSTTPAVTPIYHHTVWMKSAKSYLDVWSRGVDIQTQPWFGDPYVAFYLGNHWEQFRYDPDYDRVDVLPAPGYNGPDKLVYDRTGEVVSY